MTAGEASRAEGAPGFPDHGLDLGMVGHVNLAGQGLPALGFDL